MERGLSTASYAHKQLIIEQEIKLVVKAVSAGLREACSVACRASLEEQGQALSLLKLRTEVTP